MLARGAAARALRAEAEQRAARANAELEQARRELARLERLAAEGIAPAERVEQARLRQATAERELAAAGARSRAAAFEVAAIEATLAGERADAPLIDLRSPIDGRVLRILEKSERVVGPGEAVLIVGDPTKLEAVVDVLSNDAARLHPGMPVVLSNWGGPPIGGARVRAIEPAAFTKLSALGVEEQRVNIVIDVPEPPAEATPGDGYRADVRIVVAERSGVLCVPAAALFRDDAAEWSVFAVEGQRARRRAVQLGLRGDASAEVLSGVAAGEVVVLYPSNDLDDGRRVRPSR
jgi:HlyD family secretion protein